MGSIHMEMAALQIVEDNFCDIRLRETETINVPGMGNIGWYRIDTTVVIQMYDDLRDSLCRRAWWKQMQGANILSQNACLLQVLSIFCFDTSTIGLWYGGRG
jgi:hypothetical protein